MAARREARKKEIEEMLFGDLLMEKKEAVPSVEAVVVPATPRRRSSLKTSMSSSSSSETPAWKMTEVRRGELEADKESLSKKKGIEQEPFLPRSKSRLSWLARSSSELSVVVLGAKSTGKTLLAETVARGASRLRPTPTLGVERLDATLGGDELRIWDTSGDQRFDAAAVGLTRTCAAVVVVYRAGDGDSFAAATERLLRAKCDAPYAALALLATTLAPTNDDDDASSSSLSVEDRARHLAESADAFFAVVDPTDVSGARNAFASIKDRSRRAGGSTNDLDGGGGRRRRRSDDAPTPIPANSFTILGDARAVLVSDDLPVFETRLDDLCREATAYTLVQAYYLSEAANIVAGLDLTRTDCLESTKGGKISRTNNPPGAKLNPCFCHAGALCALADGSTSVDCPTDGSATCRELDGTVVPLELSTSLQTHDRDCDRGKPSECTRREPCTPCELDRLVSFGATSCAMCSTVNRGDCRFKPGVGPYCYKAAGSDEVEPCRRCCTESLQHLVLKNDSRGRPYTTCLLLHHPGE
ncbi:hypothetical protein CTAYLR_008631 [Chrysophaeum taylorii]|uniref:Uncharacterized protein n=1 Tax=Chrysophaeum taylorii TaxID=2483200 RepID=A0AAD7XNY2_9STRA|nr:hypothetical protein CTAYLR_008631 [Chrysophaeum taylorii]